MHGADSMSSLHFAHECSAYNFGWVGLNNMCSYFTAWSSNSKLFWHVGLLYNSFSLEKNLALREAVEIFDILKTVMSSTKRYNLHICTQI